MRHQDVQDRQVIGFRLSVVQFYLGGKVVYKTCPRLYFPFGKSAMEEPHKQMRCLVTGAAGFIGSNLSERLLELGHTVIGVDSFTDYYSPEFKRSNLRRAQSMPGYRFIEGDLLDLRLEDLIAEVDWVFHQAAQPGVRTSWGLHFDVYVRNNILVTQRLLEVAKTFRIRRFVYASSSSVYGNAPELPLKETARPQPVSPYGVSKLAAEHLCHLYYVNYHVPTVSLRYFTVYGPRQRPDMAFHRFIKAALLGTDVIVFGDGEQSRDFTYVSDVVAANIQAAMIDDAIGRVFNIGGGSRVTLNAVIDIISKLTGHLTVRHEEEQKGDVRHTLSDTTQACEVLGYSPTVGIEEGLSYEVEWMRELLFR